MAIKRKHRDNGDDASAPEILTAEKAAAASFQIAQPRGYYHVQVDEFVALTEESLRYWEQQVLEREQELHASQTELDQVRYENQGLKAQIEIFRVNGSPMVDDSGNYLTESQVGSAPASPANRAGSGETDYLAAEVTRLTEENADLYAQSMTMYEENTALVMQVNDLSDAYTQLLADVEAAAAYAVPASVAPAAPVEEWATAPAVEQQEMPAAVQPEAWQLQDDEISGWGTSSDMNQWVISGPAAAGEHGGQAPLTPVEGPPPARAAKPAAFGPPSPMSTSRAMDLPPAPPPVAHRPRAQYPPAAKVAPEPEFALATPAEPAHAAVTPVAVAEPPRGVFGNVDEVVWDDSAELSPEEGGAGWLHVSRRHGE